MKTIFTLITLCVLNSIHLLAINPSVRNFTTKTINSGTQTWDIVQNDNGWMYFANNNGLVEFDGTNWKTYPIKNFTNVRSVYFDKSTGKIFAGGSKEFGYYERNKTGKLEYHSISKKLKEPESNFSVVWHINKLGKGYMFQTDNSIYKFENNTLENFSINDKINFSTTINNQFIISTYHKGALIFSQDRFIPLPNSELLKNKKICSIILYKEKLLFLSESDGIFSFDGKKTDYFKTDIDNYLKQNQVFSATISESKLAIGTVQNGIIIKDLEDNSTIISNVDVGLQNNTVLSIKYDKLKNLWLGLDNGIDYVMANSSIYELIGNPNLVGTGYTAKVFYNKLYLGSNKGLYAMKYPIDKLESMNTNIKEIKEIKGQIWNIELINNTLFCSGDKGLYEISEQSIRRIGDIIGVWKVLPLKNNPDYIVGATYNKFFILTKISGNWEIHKIIDGINQSAGINAIDNDGNIWFSNETDGIFKLKLNESLTDFSEKVWFSTKQGLPSDRANSIFIYKGQVYFSTIAGIYKLNNETNKIEKSKEFSIFKNNLASSTKIIISPKDNIWAITASGVSASIFKNQNGFLIDSVSYFPLKDKMLQNFPFIGFLNDNEIIFGTQDGFSYLDNSTKIKKTESHKISITNITLTNIKDSTIKYFVGNDFRNEDIKLEYKNNSIRFEFVSPEYRASNSVQFSYLLDNFDKKWSEFSFKNTKEFTKLPNGKYNLRVKSRNLISSQIEETNFKFTILPPWYKTNLAYIIYLLIFIELNMLLYGRIKIRSDKAANKMELRKELEMKEQEKQFLLEKRKKDKEIIELKNQKLEYELRHKSQDLANSTMTLIRKNEILTDINNKLEYLENEFTEKPDLTNYAKQISEIKIEIRNNIGSDHNWTKFQQNFDIVYENYLKRLAEEYPNLTLNDLKICAYLKMELSSKDIAPLVNTSYQSVEMSRHRLRKKLNLSREINLTEFLRNF